MGRENNDSKMKQERMGWLSWLAVWTSTRKGTDNDDAVLYFYGRDKHILVPP